MAATREGIRMNVEQVKNNLQKVQDISAEIIDENLHIYPKNKDEVCKLLKWCNENKIPIVPKGSGSHIDEQVQGSVFISMKKMNKIIELSRADLTVSVEGGITIRELSLALKEYNFLLPVSFYEKPSSTIGGLLVRNAGGIEQYAYGTINDYLLGLEFVTPTGTLIKTGGKTVKNVSGYDFTRLFAKSWGTLGIITGATFKLIPMPQTKALFIISGDKIQEIISQMKEILLKRLSLVTFMVFDSSLVGAETERKLTGIFVLAGMMAAYELRKKGFQIVIYEAGKCLGGMLPFFLIFWLPLKYRFPGLAILPHYFDKTLPVQ
jgi:FAD/FMN-containing dehydrogenase